MIRTGSHGLSWAEPLIELDGQAYGPVTDLDDLDAVRLGPLDQLPWLARQQRLVFDRCGHIDPFAYDPSWLRDQLRREPKEIIGEIERSGLRGRGGAGFPAHIKWRTVLDTRRTANMSW